MTHLFWPLIYMLLIAMNFLLVYHSQQWKNLVAKTMALNEAAARDLVRASTERDALQTFLHREGWVVAATWKETGPGQAELVMSYARADDRSAPAVH